MSRQKSSRHMVKMSVITRRRRVSPVQWRSGRHGLGYDCLASAAVQASPSERCYSGPGREAHTMISTTATVGTDEFERQTGWAITPEGACKDDRCIPLPRPMANGVDLHEIAAPDVGRPGSSTWPLPMLVTYAALAGWEPRTMPMRRLLVWAGLVACQKGIGVWARSNTRRARWPAGAQPSISMGTRQ